MKRGANEDSRTEGRKEGIGKEGVKEGRKEGKKEGRECKRNKIKIQSRKLKRGKLKKLYTDKYRKGGMETVNYRWRHSK